MSEFAMFEGVIKDDRQDTNVFARFYDRTVKTDEINPATKMPRFKDVCYIEIRVKDNNTEVFDQPAQAKHKMRFPREYAMYEMQKKQVADGTPIEQFAFLTGAQVETLKCHGIFTVEALAKLTVEKASDIDVSKEHAAAVQFVKMAEHNFDIDDFLKKEKAYTDEIAKLKETIDDLKKEIATLKARK